MILLSFISLCLYGCSPEESSIPQRDPVESGDHDQVKPLNSSELQIPSVFFTDPRKIREGQASPVIIDNVVKLIAATPKGASIYLSIYMFEHDLVIDALKKSYDRGVKLSVMVDGSSRSNNSGATAELWEHGGDIEIIEIKNRNSSSAINHHKFLLFSEVITNAGVLTNIIFQTSQNFTEHGSIKLQDAVVLSDPNLYNAYYNNWQKMKALSDEQMGQFNYTEYSNSSQKIAAYFYPKLRDGKRYGGDTVVEMLENIPAPEATRITIGMSAWDSYRMEIIEKLNELLKKGAQVEVFTKNAKEEKLYRGLRELEENGAYIKMFNIENSDDPVINIHMKVMLIKESFGEEAATTVMTGTHNFTGNALWNNNEVSLLFFDHEFYDAYNNYFISLKELPGIDTP